MKLKRSISLGKTGPRTQQQVAVLFSFFAIKESARIWWCTLLIIYSPVTHQFFSSFPLCSFFCLVCFAAMGKSRSHPVVRTLNRQIYKKDSLAGWAQQIYRRSRASRIEITKKRREKSFHIFLHLRKATNQRHTTPFSKTTKKNKRKGNILRLDSFPIFNHFIMLTVNRLPTTKTATRYVHTHTARDAHTQTGTNTRIHTVRVCTSFNYIACVSDGLFCNKSIASDGLEILGLYCAAVLLFILIYFILSFSMLEQSWSAKEFNCYVGKIWLSTFVC